MNEEASADQTDLSASPPLPYVPPPALSLADITTHEPQDGLGHSDASESLTNPVEEGEDREGSAGFEFDDKVEEEVEDIPRETMEPQEEGEERHPQQGASRMKHVLGLFQIFDFGLAAFQSQEFYRELWT